MTRPLFAFAAALALGACSSPPSSPQAGGQTNWLVACDSSETCGGLECICGACTVACDTDSACAGLPGAACIAPGEEGAIALCGGQAAGRGMCLPREQAARVTVDLGARHQTLVGFGASMAYADDTIVAHPKKRALYDLLFAESGFDMLRLRNRYESPSGAELRAAREIVTAAAERLGRMPLLFMTSGTPPAALKANGSRTCAGDDATCTLRALPDGRFDYAGFAAHWRASLEAYADGGISPDYLSIQNNPNWVPPADGRNEACRFLPEEGRATVTVGGMATEVAYPGYSEALSAVRGAIGDMPVMPRLGAPEVSGLRAVGDYLPLLEASAFDAFALHLYGQSAAAVDLATLEAVRDLAKQHGRPVFQTEMQAGGIETAVLIHHALTAGGASAYLQNDIVAMTPETSDVSLVKFTDDGFAPQGPYYALSHYAKSTDPGWVRVDAASDAADLLATAWFAPDERALTVVLVNPGAEGLDAVVALPDALRYRVVRSEVTRTVFEGSERAAAHGELPVSGGVRLPPGSILTIALEIE